ncbi:MAG: universal stress protein [Candidatus Eiseniibacteriota bacterium]
MTIQSILVHIDDSKNCAARLDLALRLASQFKSHLAGLHVAAPVYVPPYMAAELGSEIFETQKRVAAELATAAEATFKKAVAKVDVETEWRRDDGYPGEVVAMHARYADLTVVGQNEPEGAANDVAETVLMDSGRPTLVVPYAGRFERLGERVLVAWNASREAARAVSDALPFLTHAKSVTVMAVNPQSGPTAHGEVPGADISLFLARHGVKTEATQVFADDIDVGDMLLSRAADLGSDLLVMGAYGRSRLTELVLGGATRQILSEMTIPVLMSH